MKIAKWNDYQKTKYLSGGYFVAIALINLFDGVLNDRFSWVRELLILVVLTLPLLVNRRMFFLGYGFFASLFSLVIFILYIVGYLQSPVKTGNSVWFFLLGCMVFSTGLLASLGLVYIGMYTGEKNTFRLV